MITKRWGKRVSWFEVMKNVLELGGHGEYTHHSIIHLQDDLCYVNFISIKVVLNKDYVVQ